MERVARRRLIKTLLFGGAAGLVAGVATLRARSAAMGDVVGMGGAAAGGATDAELTEIERGNFAAVFGDPGLQARFHSFLKHVFHLYPEDQLQALIADVVAHSGDKNDGAIYQRIAERLPEVAPTLGAFRYALPALRKQQAVLAGQTLQLLGGKKHVDGYLEIGSDGRYYSALTPRLQIDGPVFTSSPKPPGYGPDEILDRQQLGPVGTHLPMRGYQPLDLPASSLDLATIYVGLHHVPLALRDPYVASIRAALRPGATLILRDHDVSSADMQHLVALAHDVFNVGTDQPWSANEHELRNFYPLEFIVSFLEQHGFAAHPGRLLQDGDPTRNTLLAFSKV